jgi:hypothetical protein
LSHERRECFEEIVGYVSGNNGARDYIEKNNTTNNRNAIRTSSSYKTAETDNIRERAIVLVRGFLDFGFL